MEIRSRPSMWLLYVWRRRRRRREGYRRWRNVEKVEQRREGKVDVVVGMEMGEWRRKN